MKKPATVLRAAAVALAATLALSACTGQSPSSDTDSDLTLSLSVQAPTADLSVGNFTGGDPTVVYAIYDRLVVQGIDGKLVPSIAESWEATENNTVLTFKLRDGQKFSNGETLDAAAVVSSIEASRVGPGSSAQLTSISSVEAPDASTVVIRLSYPDAGLIYQLAANPGMIGAPSLLGSEESKLSPIGSGAYVLDKEGSTVGSSYRLTRNPDYWDVDEYPYATIDISVIADPTAVQNAMKTGQIDWALLGSPDLASQFQGSEFIIGESLPSAIGVLMLTDRAGAVVPALGDVRVRQAINLAIDRDAIAEKLTAGSGEATAQMVSPAGDAYDPALDDTYPYDVDKAKSLMAEAGYADGFSVTMPSTVLSTTFDATIAQQLGEIGISVTYETVPFQDLYSKLYANAYGMFWFYNGYSGSDAKDISQVLSGSFNPEATTTPELTALLDAAGAAPLEEQGAAFRAVNKYFVDEAWFAPVNAAAGIWVSSKDVTYTPPVSIGISLLAYQPAS